MSFAVCLGKRPPSQWVNVRGHQREGRLVTHVVSLTELEAVIGMMESDADQRMKVILENKQ